MSTNHLLFEILPTNTPRLVLITESIFSMENWKLKRELSVIGNQLASPFTFVINRLQKSRYEKTKKKLIRLTDGAAPLNREIAIFLIYQPKGVAASVLRTCRHLVAKGVSPLVVANAPLNDADRACLEEVTWRIMERPNFGYDFGGYREGFLYLHDQGIQADAVLALNDSIWFPLFADSDLLDRLLQLNLDVASPVVARFKHRAGETFLHSYMMRFGRRALQSEGFMSYWRELPMSNNKMAVVRGGEKFLAMRMQALGLTTGALWSTEDVAAAIVELPEPEFQKAVAFAAEIYKDSRKRFQGAETFANMPRDDRKALVASGYFGRAFLKTYPGVTIGQMRAPFLKKLQQGPFAKVRNSVLTSDLANLLDPVVREELENWDVR